MKKLMLAVICAFAHRRRRCRQRLYPPAADRRRSQVARHCFPAAQLTPLPVESVWLKGDP
jgi:hypothetical protein